MTIIKLRMLASDWAEEQAENDLKSWGDGALARLELTDEAREEIRKALIYWVRTAAGRTVGALKLHNHLRNVD